MLVIGLMSGTSADGIDAALVEWPETSETSPFRLLAHVETKFSASLQKRIHGLAAGSLPGGSVLPEYAALDAELGELFAASAIEAANTAKVPLDQVAGVASHGQTVAHHPELRASLQIGARAAGGHDHLPIAHAHVRRRRRDLDRALPRHRVSGDSRPSGRPLSVRPHHAIRRLRVGQHRKRARIILKNG